MNADKMNLMRPTTKALILPIAVQLVAWCALAPFTVHSVSRVSELLGVALVISGFAIFSWEICAAPIAAMIYIRDSNSRTARYGIAVATSLIYIATVGAYLFTWL